MRRKEQRDERQIRRKRTIRKRVFGVPDQPRLTVFRSLQHIYAQVIDDLSGRTLASASSLDKSVRSDVAGGNCSGAKAIGTLVAERARAAGVERVIFDRNGNRYQGRVKALADAAREAGLKF